MLPKTAVSPRKKMVGAMTPGIAAPGTRMISLAARRSSARTVRMSALSVKLRVSGTDLASNAKPPPHRERAEDDADRSEQHHRAERLPEHVGGDGRDDRIADALGDEAERVVLGDAAGRLEDQVRREERRAEEQDHED